MGMGQDLQKGRAVRVRWTLNRLSNFSSVNNASPFDPVPPAYPGNLHPGPEPAPRWYDVPEVQDIGNSSVAHAHIAVLPDHWHNLGVVHLDAITHGFGRGGSGSVPHAGFSQFLQPTVVVKP